MQTLVCISTRHPNGCNDLDLVVGGRYYLVEKVESDHGEYVTVRGAGDRQDLTRPACLFRPEITLKPKERRHRMFIEVQRVVNETSFLDDGKEPIVTSCIISTESVIWAEEHIRKFTNAREWTYLRLQMHNNGELIVIGGKEILLQS